MNTNQDDIFIDLLLLKKCTGEILSDEEVRKLTLWLQTSADHVKYYEAMQVYLQQGDTDATPDIDVAFERFKQKIGPLVAEEAPIVPIKRHNTTLWLTVTAAAILLVAIGISITLFRTSPSSPFTISSTQPVSPLLGQGKSATSDSVVRMITEHGESIALQPNLSFEVEEEQLEVKDNVLGHQLMAPIQRKPYHIITPKGEKFAISLPDGTKVWLNENSQLRYTLPFSGNERRVFLEGEGYFEVAKNYAPFVVQTGSTEVKAYGTVFNVNAFDKRYVKALLVEGSIGVKSTAIHKEWMIEPGQLAQLGLSDNQMNIKDVHSDDYIAWLKGEFNFQELALEDILESLMNHYHITSIRYSSPDLKDISLSAHIKTHRNIIDVLDFLAEATNLDIQLTNGHILVRKN